VEAVIKDQTLLLQRTILYASFMATYQVFQLLTLTAPFPQWLT